MGEYTQYNERRIKIGTCEDMLYLRADQAVLVMAERGSVDPFNQTDGIRFRFPFPDEDSVEPGAFQDPFRRLYVFGAKLPDGIDHHSIQFSNQKGLLVSLPCPESPEGKAATYKVHKNGYGGEVAISQQRLIDGKLVLICECGSCGAKYRCPTLVESEPVIEALLTQCEVWDQRVKNGLDKHPDARLESFREIAKRILDGYTQPNHWTASPRELATA